MHPGDIRSLATAKGAQGPLRSVPRGIRPEVAKQQRPRNLVGLRDGGGSHPELDPPSS